ncbi:MAG: sigma-54-dependent Fis family transcriptional regulator [Alphaproteobacteria bacterium]|nr:sigma-54-dependent Fis family transcriptional regulator [Alphaproteobacteria bacterium]MCB9792629.1 sigma-54-dependent Fis family transcriptional regulator [Alphaproteobacteria bacterium]
MSQSAPRRRILVVDDEESLRHVLTVILSRAGYEVVAAADGEEALAALAEHADLSLALCDVRMPRLDGLGFLRRLRDDPPVDRPVHVIVMSAYGSMELAMEAMKTGATDYISKPFKSDEILLTLRKVEERERLMLENARLRAAMRASGGIEGFIGRSPAVQRLLQTVRKVAAYPSTVLITGESGTGKELLAKGLHALSDRAERPFVAINCGAIPENLLESELFGHVRGAFTGAVRERAGLFEQADGGTLLLDELGELPSALQVKLLRALEESSVRRVGSNRELGVDVRVIAATSRDLAEEVAAGRFRGDLFYRLDVVHLRVPPLRERSEDIPTLVEHFVSGFNARLGKRVRAVAPEAMRALVEAPWPGNVRQLENAIERAVLLAESDTLRLGDLPPRVGQGGVESGPVSVEEELSIKRRTAALERELIAKALERSGGNRSQAARVLEISYKALLYKIRDYGLEA